MTNSLPPADLLCESQSAECARQLVQFDFECVSQMNRWLLIKARPSIVGGFDPIRIGAATGVSMIQLVAAAAAYRPVHRRHRYRTRGQRSRRRRLCLYRRGRSGVFVGDGAQISRWPASRPIGRKLRHRAHRATTANAAETLMNAAAANEPSAPARLLRDRESTSGRHCYVRSIQTRKVARNGHKSARASSEPSSPLLSGPNRSARRRTYRCTLLALPGPVSTGCSESDGRTEPPVWPLAPVRSLGDNSSSATGRAGPDWTGPERADLTWPSALVSDFSSKPTDYISLCERQLTSIIEPAPLALCQPRGTVQLSCVGGS